VADSVGEVRDIKTLGERSAVLRGS